MDKRVLIAVGAVGILALGYVLLKRRNEATKTEVIVKQNPRLRNYAAGGGEGGEEAGAAEESSEAADLEFHWAPPPPSRSTSTYVPVISPNSGAYSVPVYQSSPTPTYGYVEPSYYSGYGSPSGETEYVAPGTIGGMGFSGPLESPRTAEAPYGIQGSQYAI